MRCQDVEFMPEVQDMAEGVVYVSRPYALAIHLCVCGCRTEVVTPLSAEEWTLTEREGLISLYPSIGNQRFPCRSHYWITDGQVRWT